MKLPKKSVFLPVHRKVHIQSIYTHNDSIVCNVCMVIYMYIDNSYTCCSISNQM